MILLPGTETAIELLYIVEEEEDGVKSRKPLALTMIKTEMMSRTMMADFFCLFVYKGAPLPQRAWAGSSL